MVITKGPSAIIRVITIYLDIHGPKRDLKDTFIKTPLVDGLGDEDDGLLWERNPDKHRRVSKMMSPAFSGNSLRAKLPTMNRHIDLMVNKIGQYDAVDISSVSLILTPAEPLFTIDLSTINSRC